MDRTTGFGRFSQLAAMTMSFSTPGVATALAQELYGAARADAGGDVGGDAGHSGSALGRKPANGNDRARRHPSRVA